MASSIQINIHNVFAISTVRSSYFFKPKQEPHLRLRSWVGLSVLSFVKLFIYTALVMYKVFTMSTIGLVSISVSAFRLKMTTIKQLSVGLMHMKTWYE